MTSEPNTASTGVAATTLAATALAAFLAAPLAAQSAGDIARAYREAHEVEIVHDFAELLSYPNRARDLDDITRAAEYIRGELHHAARREMITKLDDFLRRRSKIALIATTADIKAAPGLMEACRILFGEDDAAAKFHEYFAANGSPSAYPDSPPTVTASSPTSSG